MGALGFEPLEGQFVDPRDRLEQLVREAALLDGRARELRDGEERLARRRRDVDREAESIAAQAVELQEREETFERRQAELWQAWEEYLEEKERLDAESERIASAGEELAVRSARFDRRWRWLVDCLSLPFRRRSSARPVDALFVPTESGYRLLDQSGLAVSRGAVLRGLIEEHRRFEVTKIAALPLESRVCAYLQETSTKEGVES